MPAAGFGPATHRLQGGCSTVGAMPAADKNLPSGIGNFKEIGREDRGRGILSMKKSAGYPALSCPWWDLLGSNQRPHPCEGCALPAELKSRSGVNVTTDRNREERLFEGRNREMTTVRKSNPFERSRVILRSLPIPLGRQQSRGLPDGQERCQTGDEESDYQHRERQDKNQPYRG